MSISYWSSAARVRRHEARVRLFEALDVAQGCVRCDLRTVPDHVLCRRCLSELSPLTVPGIGEPAFRATAEALYAALPWRRGHDNPRQEAHHEILRLADPRTTLIDTQLIGAWRYTTLEWLRETAAETT